jgi:hypothetical protein
MSKANELLAVIIIVLSEKWSVFIIYIFSKVHFYMSLYSVVAVTVKEVESP